jgi:hypothetical protein
VQATNPQKLAAIVLAAALAVVIGPPASALAAGPVAPQAQTHGAQSVSYASATLTGSVNPRGSDTSYYFQYGPTHAYGGQSPIGDAGAGTSFVKVSLPVGGLQPLTLYHYRLVTVSAGGVTMGGDRTFLTTKVPLSLQILAAPNPVTYGGSATVQGALSGTGNAGQQVVLQANSFPFTAGFQNLGNPQVTSATGGFSFPVLSLTSATKFQVATTTNPPVLSPVVEESVQVRVESHLTRARRRHARFYGTVTPAENGMQVAILRLVHGRGVLVGGTVLRPRNATSSRFSRVVPVKPGVYRVLVRVTGGPQSSNYGRPLAIR